MGGGYRLGKCSATKFYSHSRSVAHLFLFRIDKLVRVGLEMLGIQDLDWAKDAELYQARVVWDARRGCTPANLQLGFLLGRASFHRVSSSTAQD